MKITNVKLYSLEGHMKEPGWVERNTAPLDIYPEFNGRQYQKNVSPDSMVSVKAIYLEVQTDEGVSGLYGPIYYPEEAFIIQSKLKPLLLGRNPLDIEMLWDQMVRLERHGCTGMMMMAISGVDCALWDLRGKFYKAPVHTLLGGPTRSKIKTYVSTLGYSIHIPDAVEKAKALSSEGFTLQKWFFRYGPDSGLEGMEKNIELVAALREAVGNKTDLAFDCSRGWDVDYTIAMAKEIESFKPKWLEEPIMPNNLDGYKKIRSMTSIPLASGEHSYTRLEVKPFLDEGILDYIQTDPDWTGGITELRKIGIVVETYGAKLLPHGHTAPAAAHVISSLSPSVCPYLEYLMLGQVSKQHFHKKKLEPVNGYIELPADPGLGIVLDESKIEKMSEIDWV